MHAENLFVNDRRDGQAVERVGEHLPRLDIKSSFAFVVEAIDTIDRCAFVISTQNEKVFAEFELVSQQKYNGLD